MDKLGVSYIPSHSNFFMMAVKGMTGPQVGEAMGKKKILLAGNRWPEWPEHIRVTVGTYDQIAQKLTARYGKVVTHCEFSIPVKDQADKERLRALAKAIQAK